MTKAGKVATLADAAPSDDGSLADVTRFFDNYFPPFLRSFYRRLSFWRFGASRRGRPGWPLLLLALRRQQEGATGLAIKASPKNVIGKIL